jgi:peptide deformylase
VPRTVLLNPVITPLVSPDQPTHPGAHTGTWPDAQASACPEEEDWEGCLSVPGLRAKVPRYQHIHYQGFDQFGKRIERRVSGFHARVVQHECDHLIGKLYPMRVRDFSHFGFTQVLFPDAGLSVEGDG